MPTTRFTVTGLTEPAEILVDRWGVPHLYARSQDDVFLLQGFNAARDRLWQLDLWKRRGDGTLSEAFGPQHMEQDRAARLLLYRGSMYREWLAYASDTKRIVSRFTAGINAFIDLIETHPELLPPEFSALGYRPARWTPETVVRIRSHGLLRNLRSELSRARFLEQYGVEATRFRDWYEPDHELQVPDGLDLSWLDDEAILDTYRLGTATIPVAPLLGERQARSPAAAEIASRLPALEPDTSQGSNNWAVSPERTATGRPLLADDPHRTQAVPSLRYIAHLAAPGLDVIGAGEPALPGVSIGHNGTIAFGLTIFSIDQEDLYVYETHPDDPMLYRYGEHWLPMTRIEEPIPVRGEAPRTVELLYTRHGPVLYQDLEKHRAFALRAAWLEPGMAPYLGSIEYMRARSWDDFLAAMNRWGAPSENQVYADVRGNIGWKPGGLAPIRPNWDGLLPVPGDGRYEWQDYYDVDQLPVEANPERGWVASANQMNLPPGYEHQLGWEWTSPYRFERIAEVLSADDDVSIEDALALQGDHLSQPARRLLAVLREIDKGGHRGAKLLVDGWQGSLDKESAQAALFEIWWRRHLPEALVGVAAEDEPALAPALETLEASASRERLLQMAESSTRAEAAPARRARVSKALLDSLDAAWEETSQLLGNDPSSWQWGKLHTIALDHPFKNELPEELQKLSTVGPLPRGGSGETVGNTGYDTRTFEQRSGASFRLVIDVGNWDASVAMNNPGQSGVPGHRHYQDLFPEWAADRAFPLLYSRARVEAETTERFLLEPRKSSP